MPLKTDKNGDIISNPVTGWEIGPVAGVAIFAALHYLNLSEKNEMSEHVVQLALTPAQALELSEVLARHARKLLVSDPGAVVQ